jgi:U2 small nuclear ribonucleoprotein A'
MGLANVEELQLGYNRITDIRQMNLGGMNALRVLILQGNDISELFGLEHLPSLQELVLDKNRIRCLDCLPLAHCANLRSLQVEDNGLRRLKNMDAIGFTLESLHLGTNRLNDLQELDNLASLTRLHVLTLQKNPVARRQQYRFAIIHAMPRIHVLDGKEISPEERERVDLAYMQAPKAYVTEVSELV